VINKIILANIIQGWNYIDSPTFLGFTGANSAQPLLAICTKSDNSENSWPALQARRS
jgi:hypothetical protein